MSVHIPAVPTALLLLPGFVAWTAPVPPMTADQKAVIAATEAFLKDMGETDTLKALQEGVKSGKIRFGPTEDNANAQCDITGTKQINVNPGVVGQVLIKNGTNYQSTAELAASLVHELKHTQQSAGSWRGSFWKEFFGGENSCEKQAWGEAFDAYRRWLDKAKAAPEFATDKLSYKDRAAYAQKVLALCDAWVVYKNDFDSYQGRYGKLVPVTHDGFPISMDEMKAEIDGIRKMAKDLIAFGKLYSPPKRPAAPPAPPAGTLEFTGTFTGQASGQLWIQVRGTQAIGKASGRGSRPGVGPCTFKMSLDYPKGKDKPLGSFDPKSGTLKILLLGGWDPCTGAPKGLGAAAPTIQFLFFSVNGQVSGNTASGTWSWSKLKGQWEAKRTR